MTDAQNHSQDDSTKGQEESQLFTFCRRFERNDASLTICNLNNVSLGNHGAQRLAAALLHDTHHLVVLFADNCGIGDAGAEALANSLAQQRALKYLYLSYNTFGSRGATALAQLIESDTACPLKTLKLTYNTIGNAGAVELARALGHSACLLEQLDLEGNNIQKEGLCALAESLVYNTQLYSLELLGNLWRHSKLQFQERRYVQDCFLRVLAQHNKTLRELRLEHGGIPPALQDDEVQQTHWLHHEGGRVGLEEEASVCAQLDYYLGLNRLGRRFFWGYAGISDSLDACLVQSSSRGWPPEERQGARQ